MNLQSTQFNCRPLKQALLIGCVAVLFGSNAAQAQMFGGQEASTLRTPIIPGALTSQPFEQPMVGQPPAIGDGPTPAPVNPGMSGSPNLQNWVTSMPVNRIDMTNSSEVSLPIGPDDESAPGQVRSQLAPVIPPAVSTPGNDPGLLPTNLNGFKPPASVVEIQPQGGIKGQAPWKKWGGQTTRDLGLSQVARDPNHLGSQTTDFGQKIDNLKSVVDRGIKRSVSQDGPRQFMRPQDYSQNSYKPQQQTTSSKLSAQRIQDLYGNRTLFKGANLRARTTFASY